MTNKRQKVTIPPRPRQIDILIFDRVNLLDVAGPAQAFEAASAAVPGSYALRYISADGGPVRSSCGLRLVADAACSAHGPGRDLIVPGGDGVDAQIADARTLDLIRASAQGQGRIVSICSGAMVLAAAGVLDGLTATTHWSRRAHTQAYPRVVWDLDRIYIAQGQVHTSAGVTTGIDLSLALIQADCGPAAALTVARELIVQRQRTGGQSQYATPSERTPASTDTLAQLIDRVAAEPRRDWTLERLAEASGMHPRTLTRRFKRDLGETPAHVVEKIRADHARRLLEANVPLKRIATEAGFGDLQRLRRAFQRRFGVQPSEYRNMFASGAVL